MAKVLLAYPPIDLEDNRIVKARTESIYTSPPIGLAYIEAYLREKGIETCIKDYYLETWKTVEEDIRKLEPKYIGITCLTNGRFQVIKLVNLIKSINQDIKVIVGGYHATALPEQLITACPIDFICTGEGEHIFYELIGILENNKDFTKVPGIVYRINDEIHINEKGSLVENLDELPLPNYGEFDLQKYSFNLSPTKPGLPIITSRGCKYNCQFCSTKHFWGNSVRFNSPERVLEELKINKNRYGIKHFYFLDPLFTCNIDRVRKICTNIVNEKLEIEWNAQTKVNHIDLDLLKLMRQAGCVLLHFGIESGSKRILKNINKSISLDKIIEAFSITRQAGIKSCMLLMVGNPGETQETINETKELIKVCKPDFIDISITTIYPGAPLYDYSKDKGYIKNEFWLKSGFPPFFDFENGITGLYELYDDLVDFINKETESVIKTTTTIGEYF